jgi:hypothetical protein
MIDEEGDEWPPSSLVTVGNAIPPAKLLSALANEVVRRMVLFTLEDRVEVIVSDLFIPGLAPDAAAAAWTAAGMRSDIDGEFLSEGTLDLGS